MYAKPHKIISHKMINYALSSAHETTNDHLAVALLMCNMTGSVEPDLLSSTIEFSVAIFMCRGSTFSNEANFGGKRQKTETGNPFTYHFGKEALHSQIDTYKHVARRTCRHFRTVGHTLLKEQNLQKLEVDQRLFPVSGNKSVP